MSKKIVFRKAEDVALGLKHAPEGLQVTPALGLPQMVKNNRRRTVSTAGLVIRSQDQEKHAKLTVVTFVKGQTPDAKTQERE